MKNITMAKYEWVLGLCGLCALLVTGGVNAQAETSAAKRPNIVLFLADDMGYGNLSCYDQDKVATPVIDQLAAEGIRFTDAHSSGATCQPTRYAILSGQEYARNSKWGRIQAGTYFRDGEVLLPKLLKDAGYSTAMFGKWHLGFGWAEERGEKTDWNGQLTHGPNWCGFDYWFGMPNAHNMPPFVFIENEYVHMRDTNDPLVSMSKEEALEKGLKPSTGWGSSYGAKAAHEACDIDRLDLIMAERASAWIGRQSKDKPFFLYVPFFAPHVPLAVSKDFAGTSPMAKVMGQKNNNIVRMADFIGQLDHSVGTIMTALKEHGFDENTLVIFTSDNGNIRLQGMEEAGFGVNGKLLGSKADAWEGGHRVPFIAWWPGRVPAGVVTDHLLSTVDLYDTLLAAAGVSKPAGAGVDSLNQLPLLLDPAKEPPVRQAMNYKGKNSALRVGHWVYQHYQGPGGLFSESSPIPYGYTHSDYVDNVIRPDAPPGQLYNLKEDVIQSVNRYRDYPHLVEALENLRNQVAAEWGKKKPLTDYIPLLSEDVRRELGVH